MAKTPDKIYQYLLDFHSGTAVEISRALNLTPANIRYHLAQMVSSGSLVKREPQEPLQAGRPPAVYEISPANRGTNFQTLSSCLLSAIESSSNPEDLIDDAVNHLTARLDDSQPSRFQRWNQAVQFLNEKRYHAAWEASQEGPKIILHHCPYLDLPEQVPGICQLDTRLLEKLFGLDLEMKRKRNPENTIQTSCLFGLRSN